jgi:hypothetical protein
MAERHASCLVNRIAMPHDSADRARREPGLIISLILAPSSLWLTK